MYYKLVSNFLKQLFYFVLLIALYLDINKFNRVQSVVSQNAYAFLHDFQIPLQLI